jgi:hypothetical protein
MFYENEDSVRKGLLSFRQVVRYTGYMEKNIKFVALYNNVIEMFSPKPASECLPDWYKIQQPYTNNNIRSEKKTATIKKCIPVFDAITSGYIIFTCMDIKVSSNENVPYYEWASSFNKGSTMDPAIEFHENKQADQHALLQNLSFIPKFTNPWSIQTPKGYSVLFTTPMHRDLPFQILPGIVDTDRYAAQINFPFFLKDPNWTGIIPAGTPIVQVIPFKRESWKKSFGGEKEKQKVLKSLNTIIPFFYNAYKNIFWVKKSFK